MRGLAMSERAQLVCIVAALVVQRVRETIPYMPLPWVLGMMRTVRAERAASFDGARTWWDPSW